MPLPQPTYPPVVPQTFITAREDRVLSMGLELYARYHPGAMQQQMYQTLLEDESWEGAQESEKTKRLVQERQRIVDMRTQLQAARATGGTVSGSGLRTRGGSRDSWKETSLEQAVKVYLGEGKLTQDAKDDAEIAYGVPKSGEYITRQIVYELERGKNYSQAGLKAALDKVITRQLDSASSPMLKWDDRQTKAVITELWGQLSSHPRFEEMNTFTVDASGRQGDKGVAATIDDFFPTPGRWLSSVVQAGEIPVNVLQKEKNLYLARATPSGFDAPKDLDGDGTISAEEREVAAAKDPERLFEERIRSLDAQIAAQERRSSPMARAARRTLGRPVEPVPGPDELPYVSPEALQAAAAAGGNIAAESLPYAMRRVRQGKGTIKAETDVEEWVEDWLKQNRERSFPQFIEQVNKKWDGPGSEKAKLEAAAYYGAFYYNHDLKSQTLNQGLLSGDAKEAAPSVEAAFTQDVAGLPEYAVDPGEPGAMPVPAVEYGESPVHPDEPGAPAAGPSGFRGPMIPDLSAQFPRKLPGFLDAPYQADKALRASMPGWTQPGAQPVGLALDAGRDFWRWGTTPIPQEDRWRSGLTSDQFYSGVAPYAPPAWDSRVQAAQQRLQDHQIAAQRAAQPRDAFVREAAPAAVPHPVVPPTPDRRHVEMREAVQRAFSSDDVATLSRLAVEAGLSADEAGVQNLLNLYIDADDAPYEAPRGVARAR